MCSRKHSSTDLQPLDAPHVFVGFLNQLLVFEEQVLELLCLAPAELQSLLVFADDLQLVFSLDLNKLQSTERQETHVRHS